MKNILAGCLIVTILASSSLAIADDVKLGSDVLPDAETMAAINKQLDEQVEKIYSEERGKRDKQTIRIECIADSNLKAIIMTVQDDQQNKNYDGIHMSTRSAETITADFIKRAPKINIDQGKLAHIHLMDGDAWFKQAKIDEGLAAFEKSISYQKTGIAYFQTGLMYLIKNDLKNAKNNFDVAIKMDKNLEPNYREAMKIAKQNGWIK